MISHVGKGTGHMEEGEKSTERERENWNSRAVVRLGKHARMVSIGFSNIDLGMHLRL